jgi:hypothetical protein
MAFEASPAYAFTDEGVREGAPEESGIYVIFTAAHWVYIGGSDNIRRALFDHLNTPNDCFEKHHPLSFSSEVVPAGERAHRRTALIAELHPVCNELRQ